MEGNGAESERMSTGYLFGRKHLGVGELAVLIGLGIGLGGWRHLVEKPLESL
jgi:hypothetical protein